MAVTEKTPFSIGTFANYLHEIATKMSNSDVGWDADLNESEKQLVEDLGNVAIHTLDPDILAMFVFEDSDEGKRVRRLIGHQHNCGQRLTGPAVTVESA